MRIVALYMETPTIWCGHNELLVARLLGAVFYGEIRAHPDGVYWCPNGAWVRFKELPEPLLRQMELAMLYGQRGCGECCGLGRVAGRFVRRLRPWELAFAPRVRQRAVVVCLRDSVPRGLHAFCSESLRRPASVSWRLSGGPLEFQICPQKPREGPSGNT